MDAHEWRVMMLDLVQGVERQLRPSAPRRARAQLAELRVLLPHVRGVAQRAQFDARLEALLQSTPYFRGAAWRYLTPNAVAALRTTENALKLAEEALGENGSRKT